MIEPRYGQKPENEMLREKKKVSCVVKFYLKSKDDGIKK